MARARTDAALVAALPDALDLLAACVEGGATLDHALADVAPHVEGALGPRFGVCAAQLRSTRPRREVLRALGGVSVRELDRAGHALAAADELGSPLASTLTEQAAMQRELARLGVRERAAAAGPKIALVVAVTLVPSALVLVLGSQALSLLAGRLALLAEAPPAHDLRLPAAAQLHVDDVALVVDADAEREHASCRCR